MIDTSETVKAIKKMALELRRYADDFDRTAIRMQESGDITYAAEVASAVAGLIQNLRIDLLITRPIRAMENELRKC